MSADTLMNIIKARGLPSGLHDIKKINPTFCPPSLASNTGKKRKEKKEEKKKQKKH